MTCNSAAFYAWKYGQQFYQGRVGNNVTPDYSVLDQTPINVGLAKYWVETSPARWSQFKAPGVEWFRIIGNTRPLKVGDILTTVNPNSDTTPIITVSQFSPRKACMGFKTNRLGAIYNGSNLIFNNIQFDFLPNSSYPGAPLDREVEASINIPSVQACTFTKPFWTVIRDAEGLFLYEIDRNPQIVWEISMVTPLGCIYIMDLKRNYSR
jgi:hypothetical protein